MSTEKPAISKAILIVILILMLLTSIILNFVLISTNNNLKSLKTEVCKQVNNIALMYNLCSDIANECLPKGSELSKINSTGC